MFQNITTVIAEVAGQQDENIVTSKSREGGTVQVQSGSIWITCLDLAAVTAHAYAWATARADAAEYLPHTADITSLRRSSEPTLILRQTGYAQPVWRQVPAREGPARRLPGRRPMAPRQHRRRARPHPRERRH